MAALFPNQKPFINFAVNFPWPPPYLWDPNAPIEEFFTKLENMWDSNGKQKDSISEPQIDPSRNLRSDRQPPTGKEGLFKGDQKDLFFVSTKMPLDSNLEMYLKTNGCFP